MSDLRRIALIIVFAAVGCGDSSSTTPDLGDTDQGSADIAVADQGSSDTTQPDTTVDSLVADSSPDVGADSGSADAATGDAAAGACANWSDFVCTTNGQFCSATCAANPAFDFSCDSAYCYDQINGQGGLVCGSSGSDCADCEAAFNQGCATPQP